MRATITTRAVSVGSIFARRDKAALVRPGMIVFAISLLVFALLRVAFPAYLVVLPLGYSYFLAITSLSTVLQAHITDAVRGRVMALWIMGFGGAVGLAALVLGPVAQWSVSKLLVVGALWAAVLAIVAAPRRLRSEVPARV